MILTSDATASYVSKLYFMPAFIPVDHGFHHLVGGVVLDHLLVAALLLEPVHLDGGQAVMVHIGDVAPVREELAADLDGLDGARAVNINNRLLVPMKILRKLSKHFIKRNVVSKERTST